MDKFFVGVPFSGCEKYISSPITATREDEAIGIAVGAWFAGKTPTVYMQNSGLGNCFDIITSLLIPYGINIDLLVDNRIEPEHHRIMGERSKELMEVLGYDAIRFC